MANVIVPNKPPKDVIRIDGVCYFLKGSTSSPPTHTNAEIQSLYDDCEDCANDDLSSESSSSFSRSLSSNKFSSSSSFEISSENPCYHICIESDWSVADLNGTYTYNTVTEKWEQEGGDGTVFYDFDFLNTWVIAHPLSGAFDDRVYDLEIAHTACPPLNGWTFVPAAGGTQNLLSVIDGTCEAVQSSDSSSQGFSSSSSSLGLSSSSSSPGADNSSSSSQSGPENACDDVTCPTVNSFVDPPSIQIIITADDADLPITWCGKTWVKLADTGFHSGEAQCICPTQYNLQEDITADIPPYPTVFNWSNIHYWRNNAGGTGFRLQRTFNQTSNVATSSFYENQKWSFVLDFVTNAISQQQRTVSDFGTSTIQEWSLSSLKAGTAANDPTRNDFKINDNFFTGVGSLTVGSVDYEWNRGLNWP